jgi:hypothetical protein
MAINSRSGFSGRMMMLENITLGAVDPGGGLPVGNHLMRRNGQIALSCYIYF